MSFDQLNRVSYKTKKVLPRFLKVKLFSFYCRSLTYFQPSGITGAGGRLCRKCSPFPLSYSESDTAGNGIPSDMQDRCCEPPHLLSCMISCWQTSCPTSSSRWPRTPRHFSPLAARSSARASSTGARMRCAPPSSVRASRSRRTTTLRNGTASRPHLLDGAAGSLTKHEATFLCTLTGAARRFGKRELR